MDIVRARITELIRAMILWADRNKITSGQLREAYRAVHGRSGSTMRPNKTLAYDELFGFGRNARKYLPRGTGTAPPNRPVNPRHIEKIRQALRALNITDNFPEVGIQPATWVPFLDLAYEAITRNPQQPAGGLQEHGSASQQLRMLLEQLADLRRIMLALVPLINEIDARRPVQLRRIGRADTVRKLQPGAHTLRYTAPVPQSVPVVLLALEHDRETDEWLLINAIPDAALPLDQHHPPSGAHPNPLHIQSGSGTFDLYLIAATSRFSQELTILAREVSEDGVIPAEKLPNFIAALQPVAPVHGEGFAAGRFTYAVGG